METFLIHGEGDVHGQPYRLRDDQKLFLYRWYEHDGDGNWIYKQGMRGRPRGDAKTELLAAIACLEFAGPDVFRRTTPIIHVAAAALKQAGELFSQVQIMLGGQGDTEENSPLRGLFDVMDTRIEYRDGRAGYIERIAAADSTAQGGKTTLFLADEIHEWKGRSAKVYAVVSSALEKRANARELIITTAGESKGHMPAEPGDTIAWKLYAKGLEQRADPSKHPRFLFDWREMKPGRDLDDPAERLAAVLESSGDAADLLWPAQDRVDKWDDPEYLHSDWRRYFGNTWPDVPDDAWLADRPDAWADLERPKLGKIPPGAAVMVGVDMALRHDSVGVTVVHPLDDVRRVWATRVFTAQRGKIDHLAVVEHIRSLAETYTPLGLAYDPRFFELPARVLEEEGWNVVEVPQSPERMAPAAAHVYRQVMAGEIVHDGDPVLAAHVNAAVWREGDRGRVLSKKSSSGHIDALIAGVLATSELDNPAGADETEVLEGSLMS